MNFKVALLLIAASSSPALATEGVLARCGASIGQAFYFKDLMFSPDGASWSEDGLKNGKIVLVRLGEEWDIQFDDVVGASGYREQGFKVIQLMQKPGMVTVGAFSQSVAAIYTFDLDNKMVGWTLNGIGPYPPKVAVYSALCD